MVQLYNISVDNSNTTVTVTVKVYSSILCYQSNVVVRDCNFIRIQGLFGAAMLIWKSNANFTGNNVFTGNTAMYGGSLYLLHSRVILDGRNTFAYNKATINTNYASQKGNRFIKGSGGAIYSKESFLIINNVPNFTNNSAQNSGGAIAAEDGRIIVQRSCIFKRNTARFGGAVVFYNITSIFSGMISFINNKATVSGGTLMMYNSGIQLGSKTVMHRRIMDRSFIILFLENEAREGGAIKGINSAILLSVVNIYFKNNRAFQGGAMGSSI